MKKKIVISLLAVALLVGCGSAATSSSETAPANDAVEQEEVADDEGNEIISGDNVLNIYSSRHYDIDFVITEMFEEQTGITINMIQGNGHEMLERAIREKENPQADLFINVGAITMYDALEEGILEPLATPAITDVVREDLYGEYWTALATGARIVVYDNTSDDFINISRYSDLSDPAFADSILVRSSTNLYNVALVAALLQVEGEEEAGLFIDAMVNNMAREPQGNDRDQMRAIVAGEGRFGITNNYYLQMMLTGESEEDVAIGERMGWMFPDEAFEDISWAGVINGAANRENALRFIEFLLDEDIQTLIMEQNGEAPANRNVEIYESLAAQNAFNRMPVDYETLGQFTTRASMMMDLAGWE